METFLHKNIERFLKVFPLPQGLKRKLLSVKESKEQRLKKPALSPQKQAALEKLYYQLLKRKDFVTSGKLQFVGLEKIKEKMGSRWSGLKLAVYTIVEDVISQHIDKNDIYFSYKEDSYVILFLEATREESSNKINAIVEQIRRHLFTLDEEELRKLEIKQSIDKVKAGSFLDDLFPEMSREELFGRKKNDYSQKGTKLSEAKTTEVSTEYYRESSHAQQNGFSWQGNLEYAYIPLWEVARSALTTYLCLAYDGAKKGDAFQAYNALHQALTAHEKIQLDIKVLEKTVDEIDQMRKDGRKFYVMCPVHHETLYHFENYELYKAVCQKITEEQRQYLIFLVLSAEGHEIPAKDMFWFIKPMKGFCFDIFVEVPVRSDVSFQHLKNAGVNVIGVRLSSSKTTEQDNMNILNSFGSKAKYFKIQKAFALDVSSLSMTTSLVCAGFDYIGGSAIHEDVAKPDTIHRYRYEDLLTEMIKVNTD